MIRFQALVFSDYIPGSAPVYTGVQHMKALAQGDQIGLFAVCDQAAIGGAFTAAIEHSTDGRNWSPKSATPEINGVTIGANQATPVYGGEGYPTSHSLEFVRVRLSVALGRGARVRLYAAVRDRTTGRYASCGCAGDEEPAPAQKADARAAPGAGRRGDVAA